MTLKPARQEMPQRRSILDMPFITDWERELFAPFMNLMRASESMGAQTWAPRVDIIEKPDCWLFKADLPDVKPEDINVTIEEGVLSIRGERKFEEEVKEGNYTRFERQYGMFERRFSLPSNIKESDIKASYKNGVLQLEVQKKEEAKPKQIKIDVS